VSLNSEMNCGAYPIEARHSSRTSFISRPLMRISPESG